MPTIDLIISNEAFTALALAAHVEGVPLNDFVVAVLKDEAEKEIGKYDKAVIDMTTDARQQETPK